MRGEGAAGATTASVFFARLGLRFASIVILALAIPLVGFAISYPLWYISTHHPEVYTLVALALLVLGAVRYALRRRSHP